MAARVYNKLPRGYYIKDAARNLTQARYLHKNWIDNIRELYKKIPENMKPIIVKTGLTRGKNKAVFPYHIAVKKISVKYPLYPDMGARTRTNPIMPDRAGASGPRRHVKRK